MSLELRKSFQVSIILLSFALAALCSLSIRPYLSQSSETVRVALAALTLTSALGFAQLFKLLLPIILTKLWPGLETEKKLSNDAGEKL